MPASQRMHGRPSDEFRPVLFLLPCETQAFATVGENDPTGDEKFFSIVEAGEVCADRCHAEHQLASVHAFGGKLANFAADVPDEDLPRGVG